MSYHAGLWSLNRALFKGMHFDTPLALWKNVPISSNFVIYASTDTNSTFFVVCISMEQCPKWRLHYNLLYWKLFPVCVTPTLLVWSDLFPHKSSLLLLTPIYLSIYHKHHHVRWWECPRSWSCCCRCTPPPPVQGIKPPQPLVVGPNIVKDWKLFQQKWSNYSVITNLSRQSRAYQVALLLHTLGDDALKIYNGFHFDTPEDQRTMA